MGLFETINQGILAVQSLGQPAGSQPAQLDETGTAAIIPETYVEPQHVDAHVDQAVPEIISENQSIVTGSADQSGEYKPISTDTSTPAGQRFVDKYVAPDETINRIDYTKSTDIGDSKTQSLIKEGYSPEQATAMQRDLAKEAGNTRAALYYQNEYDKAMQSKIALSSEYHHDAQDSGLPQAPNPFEYSGDLAKMSIYKSQGVSNIAGTGLLPQFSGSLVKDANIVTKAARTGEMGDYGNLGKPFSSEGAGRILSLTEQQDIGRRAATSGLASGKEGLGWEINEHTMDKYTPELIKGAGFGLSYKEANLKEARSLYPEILTTKDMASIVPGPKGKQVIQIGGTPETEIIGGRVQFVGSGAPITEIQEKGGSFGITDSRNFAKGAEINPPLVAVTGASKTVEMVNAPSSNWLNRYTGGRTGADESIGGLKLNQILLPLPTPRGSAMDRGDLGLTIRGVAYRRSKFFKPSAKRKKHTTESKVQSHMLKPDPKVLDLSFLNKNMTPIYLNEKSFKFKGIDLDSTTKSTGARTSVKTLVNIDVVGLKNRTKDAKVAINKLPIKLPKGKVNVAGNINGIISNVTTSLKSVKNVKIK
jgi:hypothetical protein